eukprot:s4706_g1.t1
MLLLLDPLPLAMPVVVVVLLLALLLMLAVVLVRVFWWVLLPLLVLLLAVALLLLLLLIADKQLFDVVIDDIFVGYARSVHKPRWMLQRGLRLAAKHVRPGGLLISNTLDEAAAFQTRLRRQFPQLIHLQVQDYDNTVFVASSLPLDADRLADRVMESEVLCTCAPALRVCPPSAVPRRRLRRKQEPQMLRLAKVAWGIVASPLRWACFAALAACGLSAKFSSDSQTAGPVSRLLHLFRGDEPQCSKQCVEPRGSCVSGRCVCKPGFTGASCEEVKAPPVPEASMDRVMVYAEDVAAERAKRIAAAVKA